MSTSNLKNAPERSAVSQQTVESPDKQPPAIPMPLKRPMACQRTERPVEPFNPYQAYARYEEEAPIGNPKAIAMLKLEGQLGIFYNREQTTRVPTLVEVNFDNIRGAAYRVISSILLKQLDTQSIDVLVHDAATNLANGVCVMTYNKLRIVNYHDERVADRYRRKPEAPCPFEVPLPYALAISQLGSIKLSGMVKEVFLSPTAPAHADVLFGCDANHTWSAAAYSRSVEFAKKLGLRFTSVDLTVKMGSTWWCYRPAFDADATNFRLECPYPEENFTMNTAILASLFLSAEGGGFNNPVINLAPLGNAVYGYMLKTPVPNISFNTYYAITEERK